MMKWVNGVSIYNIYPLRLINTGKQKWKLTEDLETFKLGYMMTDTKIKLTLDILLKMDIKAMSLQDIRKFRKEVQIHIAGLSNTVAVLRELDEKLESALQQDIFGVDF